MIAEGQEVCALCRHFKMKEYPKHASVGLGRCVGQSGATASAIKPFVHWARKGCKQYAQPANLAGRVEWIEKQRSKQQIAVQTETKG